MFNNCNQNTNGEVVFFNSIKNKINVIFDVGCRDDSSFLNFEGNVHYFDPVLKFIENISIKKNKNKNSFFNNFGLSNENNKVCYYPKYQSFLNRIVSCGNSEYIGYSTDENIMLDVKKSKDYVSENNIDHIDFLKIDTEGYELNVLKGFEDYIKNIKIIQFEYGGTYLDNNTKLIDVINYLSPNFYNFSYLSGDSEPIIITDFTDHYQYCNIICFNKTYRS